MSDMMDPDEPQDPEDQIRDEAFRAEADSLIARGEGLAERAKKLGLYAEGPAQITMVPTPFGPRPALVQQFQIGRIAFTDRVQDPDTDKFNDDFRTIEVQAQDDAFLDERARIQARLDAGLDPYGDDDEEDGDADPS